MEPFLKGIVGFQLRGLVLVIEALLCSQQLGVFIFRVFGVLLSCSTQSSWLCEVEESGFIPLKTRGHWLDLEFGYYNKENFR